MAEKCKEYFSWVELSEKIEQKFYLAIDGEGMREYTEGEKGGMAVDGYPMREATCCFTGHRPSGLPWGFEEGHPDCVALKNRLREELRALYDRGCRHFITGMARGADLYFAEAVLELRDRLPGVTLEAAIPCATQSDSWRLAERMRYADILERCDMETMVQREYTRDCMLRRNRYMVERSGFLLAVYNGEGRGGTMYTLNYAMDQGLETVILTV